MRSRSCGAGSAARPSWSTARKAGPGPQTPRRMAAWRIFRMPKLWPSMAPIQEISARIGRVTGKGIAANLREHYSVWLLRPIVTLLLVANFINLGADLGAMGDALRLLIGGPRGLYVILFAAGCTVLEIFSSYERYVKVLKWLTLSLFAYVAVALIVQVPWREVGYNTIGPHILSQNDYIVVIVARSGTTI